MSAGRILGLLLAVGVVVWLIRSPRVLGPGAPADKARAAARASGSRSEQTEAASRALESPASASTSTRGGSVSENMTPEQVRALIGSPDSVESQTGEDGITRERWTYRQVGKTVVFENGVVVRVE